LDRIVDTVTPTPPNVETRRKPSEEQLAHVLESTLIVEPEKNEVRLILDLSECLSTYIFMLTTMPKRIAVIFERIKPANASCGR
jgi:hypothetical protein